MNLKKTLILAVILLAASYYLVKVELPAEVEQGKIAAPFQDLKPEHVSRIVINNSTGEIRLVNSKARVAVDAAGTPDENTSPAVVAQGWEIEGIPGSDLDGQVLQGLFSAMSSLRLGKALPADEVVGDGSAFGLKTPELKLAVTRAGESTAKQISFGKMNDYLGQRYLRVNEEPATFLAYESVVTAAEKKAAQFRDATPIDFVDGKIKKISLTSKLGTVKLELNDAGQWRITEPVNVRAADEVVAEISRELRNLKADDFVDGPDRTAQLFGLEKPSVDVTIEFNAEAQREPLHVVIGGGVKGDDKAGDGKQVSPAQVFMTISGVSSWFKLGSYPAGRFEKSVEQLREKQQFTVNTSRLEELTVEATGREKITITQKVDVFTVNGQPGDEPFVREYLRTLTTSQATGFGAVGAGDFKNPYATITLKLAPATEAEKTAPEVHTLVIGAVVSKTTKDRFVMIDNSGEVLVYGADTIEKLIPSLESLKKIAPTPVATGTVAAAVVE